MTDLILILITFLAILSAFVLFLSNQVKDHENNALERFYERQLHLNDKINDIIQSLSDIKGDLIEMDDAQYHNDAEGLSAEQDERMIDFLKNKLNFRDPTNEEIKSHVEKCQKPGCLEVLLRLATQREEYELCEYINERINQIT